MTSLLPVVCTVESPWTAASKPRCNLGGGLECSLHVGKLGDGLLYLRERVLLCLLQQVLLEQRIETARQRVGSGLNGVVPYLAKLRVGARKGKHHDALVKLVQL